MHFFKLSLLLATATQILSADAIGMGQKELPTAQEVVAHYVKALGGEESIKKHQSTTIRGVLERYTTTGIESEGFLFLAASPNYRVESYSIPKENLQVSNGFDGKTAWSYDPGTGPRILSGNDRESARRDADYFYPLEQLTWFKSLENVGVEEFDGRKCYHLHGITIWNKAEDQFYEVKSGRLAGYEFKTDEGLLYEAFSQYRKLDGMYVAMKQNVRGKAKETDDWKLYEVRTFEAVSFNNVDPSAFAPPPAVQALVPKQR